MVDKIKLLDKFARFSAAWQPKIIAALNGQYVKLARFRGAFIWHHRAAEDELFLVVAGRLRIEFRDRAVELGPGELIVVPAGVEHRPVADEEALVLLVEPQTTRNTGEVVDAWTVAELEWV
jgi:mannose-6-phosphate isomerase-like protein (cupin superfamily)